jgi:tetratricopeptide (TPR) repeat protein
MENGEKNMRRALLLIALSASLMHQGAYAHGNQFPGRGAQSDWLAAVKMYNQANALRRSAKPRDAIKLYEQAIAKYPYDADFYTNLGLLYQEDMNQLQKAELTYRAGLKAEPEAPRIKLGLAGLLFGQHKYEQSQRLVDECSRMKNLSTDERRSVQKAKALLARHSANNSKAADNEK